MQEVYAATTTSFRDGSIEEVNSVACSEHEHADDERALIGSFKLPFPMQEREISVVDGEMDAYG